MRFDSDFSGKAISCRFYSTERGENVASHLLSKYLGCIENTFERNPHGGLILAGCSYREPYPLVNQTDLLCLTAMDLLIQYAYPAIAGYSKFNVLFTMKRSYGVDITFTIGNAIPLTLEDGNLLPKNEIDAHLERSISKYIYLYEGDSVHKMTIRVYTEAKKSEIPIFPKMIEKPSF
uniref:Uncharacterized protein orf176b n=1 Tax=Beta vulgaris subsp. maritima TaxID=350892 RepID=E8ZC39_BETVM|nr:hypothetical protein [Beta vulgaris subsp. maritima]